MLQRINDYVVTLRKHDTISSSLFSRKVQIPLEFGKKILGDLVSIGIMEYFIIVPCSNPIEDAEHYAVFSSLEDLNLCMAQEMCPVCDQCGSRYDVRKAKIGYRRRIQRNE